MSKDFRGDPPSRGPRPDARETFYPRGTKGGSRSNSSSRSPSRRRESSYRTAASNNEPLEPRAEASKARRSPVKAISPSEEAPTTDGKAPRIHPDRPALQRHTSDGPRGRGRPLTDTETQATEALSSQFAKHLKVLTKIASLEVNLAQAKQKFAERESDYNKSKDQHKKFPSTGTYQRTSLEDAKRKCKSVEAELEQANSELKDVAKGATDIVLPVIIAAISHAESTARDRMYHDLSGEFENERKANQEFRENQTKQQTELNRQLEKATSNLLAATNKIEQLESRVPTDLTPKLQKIDKVSSRLDKLPEGDLLDFSNYKLSVENKYKSLSEQITSKSNLNNARLSKIEDAVDGPGGLKQGALKLSFDIKETFRNLMSKANDNTTSESLNLQIKRIDQIELQNASKVKELDSLNAKVDRVALVAENKAQAVPQASTSTPGSMTSLQKRMTSAESSISSMMGMRNEVPDHLESDISLIDTRLTELEKRQSTPNVAQKLARDALISCEMLSRDIKKLQEQISQIEKEDPRAQPSRSSLLDPATLDNSGSSYAELASKVEGLSESVMFCKKEIEDIQKSRETENPASLFDFFSEEQAKGLETMQTQLVTYQNKLNVLEDLQKQQYQSNKEDLENTKKSIVAISDTKALETFRADERNFRTNASEQQAASPTNHNESVAITQLRKTQVELAQEIRANANGVNNLEARMNNIDTSVIASHIADQAMTRFASRLDTTEANVARVASQVQKNYTEVADKLKIVDTYLKSANAVQTPTANLSKLQASVDANTKGLDDTRVNLQAMKDQQISEATKIISTQVELDLAYQTAATRLNETNEALGRVNNRVANLETRNRTRPSREIGSNGSSATSTELLRPARPSPTIPSRHGSEASDRNSVGLNNQLRLGAPNQSDRPGVVNPTNRQASMSNDPNKKRKHTNGGSAVTIPGVPPTKRAKGPPTIPNSGGPHTTLDDGSGAGDDDDSDIVEITEHRPRKKF